MSTLITAVQAEFHVNFGDLKVDLSRLSLVTHSHTLSGQTTSILHLKILESLPKMIENNKFKPVQTETIIKLPR